MVVLKSVGKYSLCIPDDSMHSEIYDVLSKVLVERTGTVDASVIARSTRRLNNNIRHYIRLQKCICVLNEHGKLVTASFVIDRPVPTIHSINTVESISIGNLVLLDYIVNTMYCDSEVLISSNDSSEFSSIVDKVFKSKEGNYVYILKKDLVQDSLSKLMKWVG